MPASNNKNGMRALALVAGGAMAMACAAGAIAQLRTVSKLPTNSTVPATSSGTVSPTAILTYDPFRAGTTTSTSALSTNSTGGTGTPGGAPGAIEQDGGNLVPLGLGRPTIRDPFRPPPRSPFIPTDGTSTPGG